MDSGSAVILFVMLCSDMAKLLTFSEWFNASMLGRSFKKTWKHVFLLLPLVSIVQGLAR